MMRAALGARRALVPALALAALVLVVGCGPETPPLGPEQTCVKACETRVDGCSPRECRRGCNIVVDRLVEREGDHVLACVARAASIAPPPGEHACGDRAWARCAIRVGPYADGGPPAPPPPRDDVFEDEGD
jgi:hypothetical protein